jgi:hypothetical protein
VLGRSVFAIVIDSSIARLEELRLAVIGPRWG